MTAGLIALDFDNTLLRSDGTVSERTNASLSAAADAGWLIVGATGRPRMIAAPVAAAVPAMRYLVCLNGTQTVDVHTDTIVADQLLDHDEAVFAATACRSTVADVGLAIDLHDGSQVWEAGFAERVPTSPGGLPSSDALAELRGLPAPVRKVLAFSDRLATTELQATLAGALGEGFGVAHAGLEFVEIGRPGVSKATALDALATSNGLAVASCVAFGDALNDHEMLRWAGVGVAMGNADHATRAIADEVTTSNDEDGIALWIEAALAG